MFSDRTDCRNYLDILFYPQVHGLLSNTSLSKSLSAIFLVAIVGVFYVFFFDSSDTCDEQDTVIKKLESVPIESVSAPPEMPKEEQEIKNGIEDISSQPSAI
jgi:hypothetical protein